MKTLGFNVSLAAAISAALIGGVANAAGAPTPAQAAGAGVQLWVAGSSAMKNAFKAAVVADLCGANGVSIYTSNPSGSPAGTPDFNAYSCTQGGAGAPNPGVLTTIYYRAEGGSAVGVYPVINNTQVKYLDLSSCPNQNTAGNQTCAVAGTSSSLGPTDAWGAGTSKHAVELGISDLEPQAFVGPNSPIGTYSAAFTGPVKTAAQLGALPHQVVVQQTFGMMVNKNLITALNAANGNSAITTLNLTHSALVNLFGASYYDWAQVPAGTSTAPGATLAPWTTATADTTVGIPIALCNREVGSGTRTGFDEFFETDTCNKVGTNPGIVEVAGVALDGNSLYPVQPADNFSTSEEENCINTHGSAATGYGIGYVGVDKFTDQANFANIVPITIDGVTASNIATATGQYSWAYEVTLNSNATAIAANANAPGLITFITKDLQDVNKTAQLASLNALPGTPATNLTPQNNNGAVQTVGVVYTTSFSRAGNSCSPLTQQ
jgi:hypothetical protein